MYIPPMVYLARKKTKLYNAGYIFFNVLEIQLIRTFTLHRAALKPDDFLNEEKAVI